MSIDGPSSLQKVNMFAEDPPTTSARILTASDRVPNRDLHRLWSKNCEAVQLWDCRLNLLMYKRAHHFQRQVTRAVVQRCRVVERKAINERLKVQKFWQRSYSSFSCSAYWKAALFAQRRFTTTKRFTWNAHNSRGERVLTSWERIEIMRMTQWHSPPKILGWCGKTEENEK